MRNWCTISITKVRSEMLLSRSVYMRIGFSENIFKNVLLFWPCIYTKTGHFLWSSPRWISVISFKVFVQIAQSLCAKSSLWTCHVHCFVGLKSYHLFVNRSSKDKGVKSCNLTKSYNSAIKVKTHFRELLLEKKNAKNREWSWTVRRKLR